MALVDKRPEAIKGRYFRSASIKTTMGPPIKLDFEKYAAIVASS